MIRVRIPSDCCGCSACAQKCPKNAITMRSDEHGFEYPHVDTNKCVECGLCEIVCPIWKGGFERKPVHTFAVKHKDVVLRTASASGGAFSLFANDILNRGGVVYGAAFDANWDVCHIRVSSNAELWRLRGSKYVQSSLAGIFPSIKKDLASGISVLFSGLPCQVSALNMFLGSERAGLTTIELVCGGICSPEMWRDYLTEECKRLKISKEQIKAINFRDKTKGWVEFSHSLDYTDGQGVERRELSSSYWRDCKNPYMKLFIQDHVIRPSCFSCRFKSGRSGADYAIADFWGIEQHHKDFYDKNGVSLLLQYNSKDIGQVLSNSEWMETPYEDGLWGNPAIVRCLQCRDNSRVYFVLHKKFHIAWRRAVVIGDWYVKCRDGYMARTVRFKSWVKRAIKFVIKRLSVLIVMGVVNG